MPRLKRKSAHTLKLEARKRRRLERADRTPEELMLDRRINSQKARERRAKMTPEAKAQAAVRASILMKRRRQSLSAEEQAMWRERHAQYQRERRAKLSPDTLARIRQVNAERARMRRAALTEPQLAKLRQLNAERTRERRARKLLGIGVCASYIPIEQTVTQPQVHPMEFFNNIGLTMQRVLPVPPATLVVPDEEVQLMSNVKVEIVEGSGTIEF